MTDRRRPSSSKRRFVRAGLLPEFARRKTLPDLAPLIAEYRRLEAEVPVPTRAPGVLEATAFDQPLFERGNLAKPGAPVPRRFLEAFGGAPYKTPQRGRLELAEDSSVSSGQSARRRG